jgi:hypothetical protein
MHPGAETLHEIRATDAVPCLSLEVYLWIEEESREPEEQNNKEE